MRNLGGNVNVKSPGQNVAVNIRRSTRDETLEPMRRTSLNEDGTPKTAAQLIDRLHRTEGHRGKSSNKGAFQRLKDGLRDYVRKNGGEGAAMAKSVRDDDEGFERYGAGFAYIAEPLNIQHDVMAKLRAPAKPTAATLKKSLGKTTAMLKSMGLEAGYGTDSADLTVGSALRKQSLDKRLQSTVVGGDPKPVKPKLMTKSQCQAAALKGLNSGKLTASQCQHIDVSLSMDRRIDDATMATLRELHGGK